MTGPALDWPADGLEAAGSCPACGGSERELRHERLRDITFDCAPGHWNLWQCGACASLWLDPRPTPAAIHLAYGAYYTHESGQGEAGRSGRRSLSGRLRTALANGFINRRFGGALAPALPLAGTILALMPQQRLLLEARYRHLPRLRDGARLLDVGCGNGNFLALAAALGWQAEGVEPDPAAVAAARAAGLSVFAGGIEHYEGQGGLFDEISISHVIEHVHDPEALLVAAHRLLRPGGRLYLATPNAAAAGHQRFGAAWRGLEVPRHLLLFSHRALHAMIAKAGFVRSVDLETVDAAPALAAESTALATKLGTGQLAAIGRANQADAQAPEFLTVAAWRAA